MPDFEHPHILLATLGGKPEIVTFTLDLLLQKHFPISEVIVIHPASHPRLVLAMERLTAEFVDDHYTFAGEQRIIHFRRYPLRNYGQLIDDIVDTESANATLTAMDELIDDLKRRLAVIHFSISGGRRLMSFLSISAALLNFTRRDHLWHICTPEAVKERVWANGEMHVRPEDGVQLIEVPLARMAQPVLPIALDALYTHRTEPQPERKQGNEPHGVQRIKVENEQIENERHARCERVCREASSAQQVKNAAFADDCLWSYYIGTSAKKPDLELDIAIMYHAQLVIVECKAVNEPFRAENNFLQDIDAVANLLGRTYVSKVFVTNQVGEGESYEVFKRRAKERYITVVTQKDLPNVGNILKNAAIRPEYPRK